MNIDKLVIDEDDKAYRDDLKGEALAIRGLALFDLTRIFGYPYLKDNGASLGVPIIEGLSTIDSKPTRNTVAQCYTKIIDDLTQSLSLLGEKFNKGKINKWGAMVLLSRVYLYKGENANALKMASDAIIGAEKNKYALWTNEDYPTAWGEDASASKPGEVLFEIVNLTTDLSKFLGSIHISISGAEVWNFKSSFFTLVCCSKVSNKSRVKLTISAFLNMRDICPLSIFRISINWFTNCRMRSAFRCIVL